MPFIDPRRWPLTSEFLWALEREQQAIEERAFTAAWALGSVMDRSERLWQLRMSQGLP